MIGLERQSRLASDGKYVKPNSEAQTMITKEVYCRSTMSRRISHYLTIAAMLAFSMTATAQSINSGQTLAGAWNASLVFDQQGLPPCAPAAGVLTETSPGTGNIVTDSCYASEGAGYGTWTRTGNN